jgi:hypothetical protein
MPCKGPPARPPLPPSASLHLNLRGLVFNFIIKKFLWLFFSVADFSNTVNTSMPTITNFVQNIDHKLILDWDSTNQQV